MRGRVMSRNRLRWDRHETFAEYRLRTRAERFDALLERVTWSPWTIPLMLVATAVLVAFTLRIYGAL